MQQAEARGSGLAIRPAKVADAESIAELHAASRASAYRGMLPDDYLDHCVHEEAMAHWPARMRELTAGAGEVLIAEQRGQPVGFICLVDPDPDRSVFVDNLHALPHQKGRGIGSALLYAARQWAKARGGTGLHLFVLEANVAAIGFYASRGWRLAAREDHRMAGIDVVALRYVLALD